MSIVETINRAKRVCQVCKTEQNTTSERRIPNPGYSGPCGDSFCYSSCDIDSCVTREFKVIACEECTKKLRDACTTRVKAP